MLIPRPYQREGVDAIKDALRVFRSTLLVAATGTGKTVTFGVLCAEWPKEYGRILVLAHRRELVKQAWRTIKKACPGEAVDIEMEEYRAEANEGMFGGPARIVVASKDSLKRRLGRYKPEQFGLVIVDEAHHAVKKNASYWDILKYFSSAKILGVTATPDRFDGEALGGIFDSVAYVYDILQAVNDSWLVPIQQQQLIVSGLDLLAVKSNAEGELDPEELDFVMKRESVIHGIVDPVMTIANQGGQRRPVLFNATSVEQAGIMADVCNRQQPGSAVALSGEDEIPEREYALERFRKGQLQYLCGCELFIEGFDEPSIRIVVPKPTGSRSKYAQMIGRGTRPWDGLFNDPACFTDKKLRASLIRNSPKPSLLVIDPCGVSGQHKLITALDILGGVFSPEVRKKAFENLRYSAEEAAEEGNAAGAAPTGGRVGETLAELRKAKKEIHRMEEERRKAIVLKAEFSLRPVDPFDLFNVTPKREPAYLRGRLATKKQIDFILRNAPQGTRLPPDLSLAKAADLITHITTERDTGPPSEKMALTLQRFGYDTSAMTYAEAKQRIKTLAENNWKQSQPAAVPTSAGGNDDSSTGLD